MKSRILNSRGEVLGLTTNDTIALGFEFIFLNECLRLFIQENLVGIISLSIVVLTIIILIPIRLRHRPKIIRDTIFYYLKRKRFYAKSS